MRVGLSTEFATLRRNHSEAIAHHALTHLLRAPTMLRTLISMPEFSISTMPGVCRFLGMPWIETISVKIPKPRAVFEENRRFLYSNLQSTKVTLVIFTEITCSLESE